MEIKILIAEQYDKSGFKVVRAYIKEDYKQAEKDKDLLLEHSDKNITLHIVELYDINNCIVKVKDS